ncbi:mechanosensitive ion channel family protein [Patescibacteria group bacterium]
MFNLIKDLEEFSSNLQEKKIINLPEVKLQEHIYEFIFAFVAFIVINFVLRAIIRFLRGLFEKILGKSWVRELNKLNAFKKLSALITFVVLRVISSFIFSTNQILLHNVNNIISLFIVFYLVRIINTALTSFGNIYNRRRGYKIPIAGYLQAIRIIVYVIAFIIGLSILYGINIVTIIAVIGALSAIVTVVFKDYLQGFIRIIQLTSNKVLAINDWIEIEQYKIDGIIIDITLATVKVKNWDNTISVIPTHNIIEYSLKNWEEMKKSDGRRVRRYISIKGESITMINRKIMNNIKRNKNIKKYISLKDIDHNQSNLYLFRNYFLNYLKDNPKINNKRSITVNINADRKDGIVVRISFYSKLKSGTGVSGVEAEVMDNFMTSLGDFNLEIYQSSYN